MITIDYDSTAEEFEALVDLEIGDVFKYTKDAMSLEARINELLPLGLVTLFKITTVNPGTSLYTLHGNNTLVVIDKLPIDIAS